jgi:putative ABC transport system permease protein
MKSLARSNVGFHWRLFLSAVSVLALSGCLIYVAVGISAANIRSFSAYERSVDVDLYIRAKGNGGNALQQLLTEIDLYENIDRAEPYFGRARTQPIKINDETKRLTIAEIELGDDIMLVPRFIPPEAKQALSVPGSIIVSSTLKEKHGVEMGDILWNPDESFGLEIIGFFDAAINRGFMGSRTGYGFVSPETGRLFSSNSGSVSIQFGGATMSVGRRLIMIGVGVPPGVTPELAMQRLNEQFKNTPLEAITPQSFGRQMSLDAILDNKQFQGFLVVGVFAILIPLFIIVQTLRSAILTQSQQFATMRALGIPSRHLISTAMEQAFWVGILGIGVSYCAMLGLKAGLLSRDIDMYVTVKVVSSVSVAILIAALFAGIISLTAIFKMKPQDLLR